jgi:transcription factor IIIB subunit 2
VHDRSIVESAANNVDDQLEALADEFGDSEDEESEEELDPSSEMAMAAAQGIQVPGMKMKIKRREGPSPAENGNTAADGPAAANKKKPTLRIDEEWELDETNLEKEMQGHLNDPAMIGASAVVTKHVEMQREQESAARAAESSTGTTTVDVNKNTSNTAEPSPQPASDVSRPCFTPTSKISDDPIIHEDEFKDDPEVMFCKLSERDVQLKEMIWANHNKDYMRKVQQKIFDAKLAQNGPPKQKRNRAKKPRIGEGQATPAGSAAEAAQNMLRTRAISTKLDYTRMGNLFEFSKGGPGSTYGGTSSVGSRSALPSSAGSDAGTDNEDDDDTQSLAAAPETATADASTAQPATTETIPPTADEEEEGGEDDYDNTAGDFGGEEGYEEEETFVEEDFDPFGDNNGGDEYDE